MCRLACGAVALWFGVICAGVVLADIESPKVDKPAGGEKVGTSQPTRVATKTDDNQWRFKWHNGRWWYWLPNERWVYWDGKQWTAQPPQPTVAPARNYYRGRGTWTPSNELWIRPEVDVYPNRD